MTAYFRENGLHAGDTITLVHRHDGNDLISYRRNLSPVVKMMETGAGQSRKRLVIGTEWKVIDY